jgi:hypothetical protein
VELEGQPFVRHDGDAGGLNTDPVQPQHHHKPCSASGALAAIPSPDGKLLCSLYPKAKRKGPVAASLTVLSLIMRQDREASTCSLRSGPAADVAAFLDVSSPKLGGEDAAFFFLWLTG